MDSYTFSIELKVYCSIKKPEFVPCYKVRIVQHNLIYFFIIPCFASCPQNVLMSLTCAYIRISFKLNLGPLLCLGQVKAATGEVTSAEDLGGADLHCG